LDPTAITSLPNLKPNGCALFKEMSMAVRSSFLRRLVSFFVAAIIGLHAKTVLAAGSNMPWEGPLQQVLDSVQGPVAKILAVMIIIITGLTLAFGDTSGGFRRLIQIIFGLSIAFAASSFFLSFFAFGGGALIS
jgi:type IV secretion system protein VirB2